MEATQVRAAEAVSIPSPVPRLTLDSGLRAVLVFLFAVGWGAWAIAFIDIVFGGAEHHHEPWILAFTFLQVSVATLYVPLIRPRLHARPLAGWGPLADIIGLGLVGVVCALAVLYLSDGWGTSYYHYVVASLVVPTFLIGWHRSAMLLSAFMAAYLAILCTAGEGTSGAWVDEPGNLAAVLITPVLVVGVVQYLAQLTRRLQEQREQAQRALQETSALYAVAQTAAVLDDPDELSSRIAAVLSEAKRFEQVAVYCLAGDGSLRRRAASDEACPEAIDLTAEESEALSLPDGVVRLATASGFEAVPVQAQGRTWGVIAFRSVEGGSDLQFVRAVRDQLSLGLTKVALSRQKEDLAAQEERSRIAREIHDGIAQSVYMLSLNLEKAAEMAGADAALGQRLTGLVGLAKETLLEVRHYIFDLKPLLSGDAGLSATIAAQIREFSAVSGLPVRFETQGKERAVSLSVGSCIYRTVQEALANVYRHANASSIDVRLAFDDSRVTLVVTDDGCGFDVSESPSGRGLRNMGTRASERSGTVTIESTPGSGTTVTIRLPSEEVP